MRIARSTLIGTAVAMALFGRDQTLHAQQAQAAGATSAQGDQLQEVVITGIRASLEESLTLKKKATAVVDVVTAEDIGKMPDKNVADSLKRVPGITVSSAGANEGGFDENDRVSLRGTGPSLTQTLIDGHNVASGDWFVLDQTGTVGRSVSYTLLPSELVSRVVVQKSSEASLVEGGVAGSVNIVTRKPLDDFRKPFTVEASAGVVYADLPSKTDPQFSALVSWKDPDSNFGVLAQGFYEDRHLRRDGTEILGYDQINPLSNLAQAHPDLANVWVPHDIGSAFFEQERKRTGGLINVQFRPSDAANLDLSGFYSKLEAPNYNRNYLMWATHFINNGTGVLPPPIPGFPNATLAQQCAAAGANAPNGCFPGIGLQPGYTVVNNTLTNATFAGRGNTNYGIYDQISRPDESADSAFVNLDGSFVINQQFHVDGQLGWSEGHGKTPTQNVSETAPGVGTGAFWTLNGISRNLDWGLPNVNYTQPFPPGNPGALQFGWIFGGQFIDTIDKETWAKLDGTFDMTDGGAWKDLKFGARYSKHDRSSVGSIAQGPTFSGPNGGGTSPLNYPTTYSNYPSNYNTFGGNIPTGIWFWTPAQLAAYNGPGLVQRDPVLRAYPPQWFVLSEPDTSLYVQADFTGDQWSANFGVRYVHTTEDTITYAPLTCSTPLVPTANPPCPANSPGLLTSSLFGPFQATPVNLSYDDILPSWNLRYQFSPDLVGRLAAAETMTRPDYSALSGATSLSPPGNSGGTGSGSGSNPYLKPIVSSNFDGGLEWYFAPRSLLAGTLFFMDLKNYIGFGSQTVNYLTFGQQAAGFPVNGVPVPYLLTVPINTTGRAEGLEVAYQQAFGNFGIDLNATYTDAKQTSGVQPNADGSPGDTRLVGASKNVYNVSGYYEDAHFSARISYNYRSAFYSGLDRSTAFSQDNIGTLAASFAYYYNDNLSLSLDGQNLNNPTLKYYALNTDQPRAFYRNGRQYYLTLRAKF
ncbi:MAG TPA: TonB-dependent receptor [Burkholderiaceae bacterium]|nr:TonB-dependent receptor [Burkholderiaceae bacterium]